MRTLPPTPGSEVQSVANLNLKILKQGTEAWNEWRLKNLLTTPNLRGANAAAARPKSGAESPGH